MVENDFFLWTKEVADRGAGEILLTAMHKDGTGNGFDIDLTNKISQLVPVQVIASGGAKTPRDFLHAFQQGADACLAAGMFHCGEYTIAEVKQYLANKGLRVRI